jgi:hypothetical protein
MYANLADFAIATPDDDLIGAGGDQFTDDRIPGCFLPIW